MSTTNNHINWELIARYMSGEAEADERQQVETLANADPMVAQLITDTRLGWDIAGDALNMADIQTDAALQKVMAQISLPATEQRTNEADLLMRRLRLHQRVVTALAATLALLIGWGSMHMWLAQPQPVQYLQTMAVNAPVNDLQLLDGSSVSLNNGSTLTYPETFDGNTRSVKLTGEAYFKVAPDKAKPFIIDAGQINVTVLGTSFNVMAYPDDHQMTVVVDEGLVEVNANHERVRLTKGYTAILNTQSGQLEKTLNPDINYLAWKTGQLTFEETPLHEVFATLSRTYRVQVNAINDEINNLQFTATFRQASPDKVVQVICKTFGFNYAANDGEYTISTTANP